MAQETLPPPKGYSQSEDMANLENRLQLKQYQQLQEMQKRHDDELEKHRVHLSTLNNEAYKLMTETANRFLYTVYSCAGLIAIIAYSILGKTREDVQKTATEYFEGRLQVELNKQTELLKKRFLENLETSMKEFEITTRVEKLEDVMKTSRLSMKPKFPPESQPQTDKVLPKRSNLENTSGK